MNKLLERFRKLYKELVELESLPHWKYWAESLADELEALSVVASDSPESAETQE